MNVLSPFKSVYQVSILHKSIADRYRPFRVADGPITARVIFMKNVSWVVNGIICQAVLFKWLTLIISFFLFLNVPDHVRVVYDDICFISEFRKLTTPPQRYHSQQIYS